MRIVAGQFRSRRLHTPKNNDIRPTSDKVKGAIFSSLGPKASQGRFLDCYSGTGNMALEAISRGCEFAVLVDASKQACSIIKQNIQDLQVQKQTQLIHKDIFAAIGNIDQGFDCIYIDPPYAKEKNVQLMEKLCEYHLINEDGVVVVESLAKQTFPDNVADLEKTKEKTYRDTKITYYRKKGDSV